MRSTRWLFWVLVVLLSALPVATADDREVEVPEGLLFSTFSICAIDPDTGESGVAVTTRVPFVGRAVPWVRAGVGAVADHFISTRTLR